MKTKRLGDQNTHTRRRTGECPGTAHTFPAIQLLDCHRGSALPAGRAYMRACVRVRARLSVEGINSWTLVCFHRGAFFDSKAAHGRLSRAFPRVHCVHVSGHAMGVGSSALISTHYFRFGSQSPRKPKAPSGLRGLQPPRRPR